MEVTVSRYAPVPCTPSPLRQGPQKIVKKRARGEGESKQANWREGERKESAPSLSIGRLDTIRSRVKGSKGGGAKRENRE